MKLIKRIFGKKKYKPRSIKFDDTQKLLDDIIKVLSDSKSYSRKEKIIKIFNESH